MLHIQLFVEGQEIELYKDESITLTQSIQNVRDIKKVFTDYTRTFNVPASKNNNKVFKHFYNYFIDGFDARRKKPAELYINYKPFKTGKVKLEGSTLKNNEAESYKVTFYGNTVTLPDLLGEDRLANLSGLSAFDFTYNDTNIQAYMTNGLDNNIGVDQIDDAIIFPLITHTARLIYDSSKNEANNLYTTGSNNGVSFNQLKPALRVHAIIKAIEYKYNIEFSDDFFNTTNEAYYNLYMWLHTKAGGLFTDQESAFQVKNYQLSSTSIFGAGVDSTMIPGLTIKANNIELDNRSSKVNFKLRYWVYPSDDSQTYNLVIYQNGTEFKRFDGLSGDTKNGMGVNEDVDDIKVKNGDYSAFIETEAANTFQVELLVRRNRAPKSQAYMFTSVTTFTESPITIVKQLPDMKVLDFLTGMFQMFNLTAYVDDNGKIIVQTLNDFFASSTNTWDITKYVNTEKSQVDSPIPYRQIDLGYEGTETFLANNFKTQQNKEWGKLEYEMSSKFEGQTYEIKLPFEHMMFERLRDANNFDLKNIQWGWYADEKQESTSGKPLLFYAVTDSSAVIATRNIAGTKVDITAPYMPSNSSDIWSSYRFEHMKQSLNFHAEFDEYAGPPNERTLFETYYKSYIVDLFDEKKRITKLNAFLPLKILQELSLADVVKIFDKTYRINTITTNFETNESVLELTNVVDTIDTPVRIDNIEIDIASETVTADNTFFTADKGNVSADGFTNSIVTEPVPETIPDNNPRPVTEECIVTAATIVEGASFGSTDSITLKYRISKSGQLCGTDNIDEYGFLIANASSTLSASDNIETLKANSNVTVVSTVRETGQPSLTIGDKQTIVSSLTHPATRYARFYVKTNNNTDFDEANVISDVFSESTIATVGTSETEIFTRTAGFGFYGYSSIPTLDDIQSNFYVTTFNATCGSTAVVSSSYHNGAGAYPIVGDEFKVYQSYDYTGGSNSAPSTYDHATNIYYAMAVATNETVVGATSKQGTIERYIVVEYDTAEVVAVLECPAEGSAPESGAYTDAVVKTHTNSYVFGEYQGSYYGQGYIDGLKDSTCGVDFSSLAVIRISHNGSSDNPTPGDYIKIDHYNGIDYTSSFGQTVTQLGIASERIVLCLVDSNKRGAYLVGFNRTDGEVIVVSEC